MIRLRTALSVMLMTTLGNLAGAADLPFSSDLTFAAPFDGSAQPTLARAARDYYADELRYSYGVSNMSVVPEGRGYCRYPCEGNIDLRQGTVTMWVRPVNWVGAEAGAFYFLTLEGKGRMAIGKLSRPGGDLALTVQDTSKKEARIEHDIDGWLPGRWHHIAACWSPEAISLYCDGELAGRADRGAVATVQGEHFYVGRTRWSKIGDTATDEVRIYRRPLAAKEVSRLYKSEVAQFSTVGRFPAGVEPLPVQLTHGTMSIGVGDSRLLRFKGMDGFAKPICLEMTTRIDRRACSQYYALDLWINGRRMSPYLGNSRSFTRLMNKPFFYTYAAGGEGCWFGENWVVYYGRNWNDALAINTAMAEEPHELHRYVFDITDLVRPDATNALEIRNCAYTVRNATFGSDCPLVVKDMAIRHFEPNERRYMDAYRYRPAGTVVPKDYGKIAYDAQVLPCGAIKIKCGDAKYLVESIYSYPGGIGNGFHSQAGLRPEPRWQIKAGGRSLSVVGEGVFYRIERTVDRRDNHLAVTDRIVNTSDEDLGMVVKNVMRLAPGTQEVYLCGNRNITFAGQLDTDADGAAERVTQEFESGFSSYNPTFFAKSGRGGLGFAILDDVMRLQAKVFAEPKHGGVYTDRFALAAGKSYELTWKIFPIADGGYYDFINTIRAVEGINVFEVDSTAVGQWYLSRWEDARLKKWLDDRKLKYLIVTAAVPGMDSKTRHGPAFMDHADKVVPEYRELVRKVHKARPETKVLIYFAVMHCVDEKDYEERAQSCLRIGANGKPVRYARAYFCVHVDGKDPFSDELRKYIDFCLDTIGLDGIFWDVMACERARDIDHRRWDGHSAILDEDHRIKQKISIQGIEGIPFFVELIDRIYAKKKVLVVDYFSGAKTVFDALKKHRVIGTMEGNNLGKNLVRMHLHAPLSMRGAEDPTDPDRCFQQVVQNIRNNLRHGCLYAFYGPWVNLRHSVSADHIYPITPVELHEGYVIGQKKIVTTRPGRYGWLKGEASEIVVHLYNEKGEKTPHRYRSREAGDYRLVDLDLAPDHLAVVVRRSD